MKRFIDEKFVKGGFGSDRDSFDADYDGETYRGRFRQDAKDLEGFVVEDDNYLDSDEEYVDSDGDDEKDKTSGGEKRKEYIIVDSESGEEDSPRPAKGRKKRGRVIDSDSEDEPDQEKKILKTTGDKVKDADDIMERINRLRKAMSIRENIERVEKDMKELESLPPACAELREKMKDFQKTVEEIESEYVTKSSELKNKLSNLRDEYSRAVTQDIEN